MSGTLEIALVIGAVLAAALWLVARWVRSYRRLVRADPERPAGCASCPLTTGTASPDCASCAHGPPPAAGPGLAPTDTGALGGGASKASAKEGEP